MRISDWSSDVCSSDLPLRRCRHGPAGRRRAPGRRMSGPYGREAYVRSLAPAGSEPEPLWGGHVLLRPLPPGVGVDAASASPLGAFDATAALATGPGPLAASGVVALVGVVQAVGWGKVGP